MNIATGRRLERVLASIAIVSLLFSLNHGGAAFWSEGEEKRKFKQVGTSFLPCGKCSGGSC